MIRYRLQCNKSHEFEAWFASSAAYDRLEKRGELSCAHCGSKKVAKALMAPGVATSKGADAGQRRRERESGRAGDQVPDAHAPGSAHPHVSEGLQGPRASEVVSSASHAEMQQHFLALMRQVRADVKKNAEYVGPRFADEARKIHFKETQARGIWGEATIDEARELSEEGIDCLPLPPLPEDKN